MSFFRHQKSYLLFIAFLLVSNIVGQAGQKLTLKNDTSYYINVKNIDVSLAGRDSKENGAFGKGIPPNSTKTFDFGSWWIGTFGRGGGYNQAHADLEIWKEGSLDVKKLGFRVLGLPESSYPFRDVFISTKPLPEDPSKNVEVHTDITITVKESAWHHSASDISYADYTVTVTESQKTIIPQGTKELKIAKSQTDVLNPGVNDDQIDYNEVLISFENKSEFPINIEFDRGSIKLNPGQSRNDYKFKNEGNYIPLEIKVDDFQKNAIFNQTKNAIAKTLISIIQSQDVVENKNVAYVVKLKVTPKYTKKQESVLKKRMEKPWSAKFDIQIDVQKMN